jgi:excisionase family DNA binding protein
MITAEKVYKTILNMPVREREKLFTVIARKGFEKDSYDHEEVFGDIREAPFTLKEAAEYLEVAEITMRRWVQYGDIHYKKLGKNIVFDPDELKRLKKSKAKRPHLLQQPHKITTHE